MVPKRSSIFRGGEYPTGVRILAVVSIGWLTLTLLAGIYALYIGIPINRINPVFLPSILFGIALSTIASGSKARIDRVIRDERERKEPHA